MDEEPQPSGKSSMVVYCALGRSLLAFCARKHADDYAAWVQHHGDGYVVVPMRLRQPLTCLHCHHCGLLLHEPIPCLEHEGDGCPSIRYEATLAALRLIHRLSRRSRPGSAQGEVPDDVVGVAAELWATGATGSAIAEVVERRLDLWTE